MFNPFAFAIPLGQKTSQVRQLVFVLSLLPLFHFLLDIHFLDLPFL